MKTTTNYGILCEEYYNFIPQATISWFQLDYKLFEDKKVDVSLLIPQNLAHNN